MIEVPAMATDIKNAAINVMKIKDEAAMIDEVKWALDNFCGRTQEQIIII